VLNLLKKLYEHSHKQKAAGINSSLTYIQKQYKIDSNVCTMEPVPSLVHNYETYIKYIPVQQDLQVTKIIWVYYK